MDIDSKHLAAWRSKGCRADFRLDGQKAARQMIGGLVPGGRVVGLTKGQFSLGDLLRAIVDQTGPADIVLSTWTAAAADLTHMKWLLDHGLIRSFQLIVDRSFVTRQPEYGRLVLRLFGAGAVRIASTHAKFALVSAGDWRITIRTSMNLNQNKRWESFEFDDDPDLFAFFELLVAEIVTLTPEGYATEAEVYDAFQRAFEQQAKQTSKPKKQRKPRSRFDRGPF